MDQIKIGRFIAECRKKKNLTQAQLAEDLGITDRAVSKWETGKAMPDSSIMLQLCGVLGITVNDLLNGEVVTMENYNKEMENSLLELLEQKERADRHLLRVEIVIGILFTLVLFTLVMVASLVQMAEWLRVVLILVGFLPFVIAVPFMIRIEQTAGYYRCSKCGHEYVPTFGSVLIAMHAGTTRYMKCPECGKRSWQKKILSKTRK